MLKEFKNFLLKIRNRLFPASWKDLEYFDDAWKERIQQMAGLIDDEKTLIDLGCGKMWLKNFIPQNVNYIGCDYKKRDEDTLVCDFNKQEFPAISVDLCFVSGCLEYIEDVEWFLDMIKRSSHALIISYCSLDLNPDVEQRKALGWVNHLKRTDLIKLLTNRGFVLHKEIENIQGNNIFKFRAG